MKRAMICILFASAACGRQNPATTSPPAASQQATLEFTEAAPDVSALTLDEDSSQTAGAARDVTAPFPSIAGGVKVAVKDLNDSIKAVLGQIETMIKNAPATTSGDVRTWTASKNDIDYALSIRRIEAGIFGWKMEAKKTTATDYTLVMGGKIKRKGADLLPRHGAGFIGIDLTAYKAVADGTPGAITKSGKIFAAFQRGPAARHVVYRLKDFQKDTTSAALPISTYFSAFRVFAKDPVPPLAFIRAGGRFNVSDFSDLAGAANETVTARLRRVVGVGGWARAVIRDGDLPAGTRRIVRECWNSPLTGDEALYLREVWDCTGTRNATDGTFPTCTQLSTFHYPAVQAAPAGDPEAPATRARFLAQCFPDAAARVKERLKNLASVDPPLTDDPNDDQEGADETPVAADMEQPSAPPVDNADANVIDSATGLQDVVDSGM